MNADEIKKSLHEVLNKIPQHVRLVAVSKCHPINDIMTAYEEGQRIFGENHVQELSRKATELPDDIEWHFIGHLQTNKVKLIAPYISMIESVDSMKLLREINKYASKYNRVIRVLLELHVAQEDTKYGFSPEDCRALLRDGEWKTLKNISICGLMTMATYTSDESLIAREFGVADVLFDEVKESYFKDDDNFCIKSWGMSHDYLIAISHGSNMVRVGTRIFGERLY